MIYVGLLLQLSTTLPWSPWIFKKYFLSYTPQKCSGNKIILCLVLVVAVSELESVSSWLYKFRFFRVCKLTFFMDCEKWFDIITFSISSFNNSYVWCAIQLCGVYLYSSKCAYLIMTILRFYLLSRDDSVRFDTWWNLFHQGYWYPSSLNIRI